MSLLPPSYYHFYCSLRRLLFQSAQQHQSPPPYLPLTAAAHNTLLSSLTIRSSIGVAPRNGLAFSSYFGVRSIAAGATNRVVPRDRGNSSPVEDGSKRLFTLEVIRSMSSSSAAAQAKVAPNQLRQAALRVTLLSPGFVYEPYKPREPIPFWQRWFTLSGWRRTKEDIIMEMKNAYAIARLRKVSGYSRKVFYQEAIKLYKEINMLLANGDKASLRKLVTENMFSNFKNEIKRRDSIWSSVYWELVEPTVSIRTLRARLIGIDKNDLDKAFIQLTLEFLSKQKFEAYDTDGAVVAGDKAKEVLVRDIWVFEKSLFHSGSRWRLCARLSP